MTHRDKEQARALEYARSLGWRSPSEIADLVAEMPDLSGTPRIAELEALLTASQNARLTVEADLQAKCVRIIGLEDKVGELGTALAAERESHAVTKRTVTRGTRARCLALEGALREALDLEVSDGPLHEDNESTRERLREFLP